MKFAAILAILATALAGQSFSVVTVNSGSEYQYLLLTNSDGSVVAGSSGSEIDFVLNADGSLVDTKSSKYLNVKDGNFVLSDTAQTGFSIEDDTHLVYNSEDSFGVCSDLKVAFDLSCDGFTGVLLHVESITDVDDVKPGSSDSSTTTTSESSATTSATTSDEITPGKKFGLVVINSGTQFQNVPIKKDTSHPHVFSVGGDAGSDLQLAFSDDKSSLVDQDGTAINLDQSTGELGDVAPFGREPATTGFSIVDGYFAYNGDQGWRACPSGENIFSLANSDCTGGTDIALKVVYA